MSTIACSFIRKTLWVQRREDREKMASPATFGTDTIDGESNTNADENTPQDIRQRVAKYRLQWQRAKWEHLLSSHT